ncbi:tripartite ATP-independent transporter solute receptor, DctP family [Pseudobutyrivibrio ruminis DSM 9787]|uniref:Tripartite ATP-independent transporter solute receptor, DctP family n=2 Tax=Pseudobutyrivibrio ruminis TaxID=46206 RepID=A0A285RX33_9FIRM|nr:TRAP transporter substrate-binding protein [Pseudobutyrivibrio ruminis]SOB97008.1 tripartite ATP-independent transporter solute receptor, DctP family [Pseudobutyrivibrio ruminis DSM 9787]
MRFKQLLALSTSLMIVLSFTSCGKSTAVSETQTYAWPLGTSSPEDTVTQIYAEKFAEEVYELSDGQMVIQVYPNSVLGGDRELLESCKDGDIPFIVQNTAPQVTFLPDVAIFDMPCLFSTIDDVREKVDNPEFMDKISEVYVEGGYQLLGYADQGFRVMTTNSPVYSLSDFKGQKIRTMENSYHLAFWKCLSASPTPMTFSEVYIGLQQGTIDAQENPYEVIVSNRLYEQQDYVVETNHLPHLISLVASDEFMNTLTPEQQEIISQAATIATEYARQQSDDRIASRIATIEESGTEIIPLSDDIREQIREAATPVYDSIKENVDPELYEIYTKGILY